MTSKTVSPTANLLRHSRLFSLPPPLPKPSHEFAAQVERFSDTATLPYPTHAALETIQSSLSRGDWGLKRPLPLKSTAATSTPMIRVSAIDSINHITDFSSAADHTLTLYKWQEMAMPISVHRSRSKTTFHPAGSYSRAKISVFEQNRNATDVTTQSALEGKYRWKFRGPWLAGKTEGDFQDYVAKEIKRRRPEFNAFLREWLRKRNAIKTNPATSHSGEEVEVADNTISNEDLQSEIIKLRKEPMQLWPLIWDFLDLPGEAPQEASQQQGSNDFRNTINEALDEGPPTTHPSAGLYYLRTSSHIPNHPILGPVQAPPPIIGRMLVHEGGVIKQNKHTVGIAGIVADTNIGGVYADGSHVARWKSFDPELEGGAKTYMQPIEASIDSRGRIKLIASKGYRRNILVWKGDEDEQETLDATTSKSIGPKPGEEDFFISTSYLDPREPAGRNQRRNKEQNKTARPETERRFEAARGMVEVISGKEFSGS